MKRIAYRILLPIAAVCLCFAALAGETKSSSAIADTESLVIAEVHDGVLVPGLSDDELKNVLEDAFNASDDQDFQVWLEKVWFEKHGESHYLMTVSENTAGEKLSSAIKLEEVAVTANTSAVGIRIPVAIIPFCKSITCTNNPCPMNVWEDHIECYCIAAGDCELTWRIIFLGTATAAGF